MKQAKLIAVLIMLMVSASAHSASIADVDIAERVEIDGFAQPLMLNGAGVRSKFFIKVYVAALYLPSRQSDAAALISSPPANRVLMHVVYDKVSKRQMDEAWRDGFENNVDATRLAALAERLEYFVGLFGDLREGDRVWFDFVPGRGTKVSINGERRGVVDGEDFNSALLSVWLGHNPASKSLKEAMVGVDNG